MQTIHTMHYTKNDIISLIVRFEEQKLPKSEWTHEAHLAVGIWYSHRLPEDEALETVRNLIIKHNESVGTPNTDHEGYHETITRFWLLMARRFLAKYSFSTFSKAINAFISWDFSKNNFPLHYYSEDLLFSVEARKNWVEPDILPLEDGITDS